MGAQDYNSKPPKVMGLTAAATIAVDPSTGIIFKVSPNEDETITATSVGLPGEVIRFYIDTINTTTRTITWSTGFRTTGTLATGATAARRFIVSFESDGLVWTETGRTAAQA